MKIKVDTEIIRALNPCKDRFDNYLEHYSDFSGDILEFLSLEKITAGDKVWVAVRVLPREVVEIFAIDCAVSAAAYADAYTAAYAADAAYAAVAAAYADATYAAYADATYAAGAATYAAGAATYAADAVAAYDASTATSAATERERQVDALIYLIEGEST